MYDQDDGSDIVEGLVFREFAIQEKMAKGMTEREAREDMANFESRVIETWVKDFKMIAPVVLWSTGIMFVLMLVYTIAEWIIQWVTALF